MRKEGLILMNPYLSNKNFAILLNTPFTSKTDEMVKIINEVFPARFRFGRSKYLGVDKLYSLATVLGYTNCSGFTFIIEPNGNPKEIIFYIEFKNGETSQEAMLDLYEGLLNLLNERFGFGWKMNDE